MALKGIYIRIPEDIHQKAKMCALKKNIPLQRWITYLLIAGVYKDLSEHQKESTQHTTEKLEEPPT